MKKSYLIRYTVTVLLVNIAFLFCLLCPAYAGWSLEEISSPISVNATEADHALLAFPNGDLGFICIGYHDDEEISVLQLFRYSQTGELLRQEESSLGRWVFHSPFFACAHDSNTISIALNGHVSPEINGDDILVRSYDRVFTQLGSTILASPGRDSCAALISYSENVVAVAGQWNGNDGHAFIRGITLDGFSQWDWVDDAVPGSVSSCYDLAKSTSGVLYGLAQVGNAIDQYPRLFSFDGVDGVGFNWTNPDIGFPFRAGKLVVTDSEDHLYYAGYGTDSDSMMLGGYSLLNGSFWENRDIEYDDDQAGLIPVNLLAPAMNKLVIGTSGIPGWTILLDVDDTGPSVPFESLDLNAESILPVAGEGFVIVSDTTRRFGVDGELYYSRSMEPGVSGGVRLDDTTLVIVSTVMQAPLQYVHSLRWYRERFSNEPPEQPQPLGPADGAVLNVSDSLEVALSWRHPVDPDPGSDPGIRLIAQVQRFERPDTLLITPILNDTTLTLSQFAGLSDVTAAHVQGASWRLRVISGEDSLEMESPWSFTVTSLDVGERLLPQRVNGLIWPNPSNNRATLRYTLKHPGMVTITLWNLLGQEIIQQPLGYRLPGTYSWPIRSPLSSGTYLVRLTHSVDGVLLDQKVTFLQ